MLSQWSFELPGRLLAGPGALASALAELAGDAVTPLALVTGRTHAETSGLLDRVLAACSMPVVHLRAHGEPDVATVDDAVATARAGGVGRVLAIGGGSALDLAKAVAALVPGDTSVLDHLEGLPEGGGAALDWQPLALVAVPTTAGTGSEATANSVVTVLRWGLKRSLRDPRLIPQLAVLDHDLMADLPPAVTAVTAFDALGHLLESLCSPRCNPMLATLASAGIAHTAAMLDALVANQVDAATRAAMALAAYWGGVCLSQAGLGAAHGLVAPLGGRAPVGHAHGIATLLAPTVLCNARYLPAADPRRRGLDAAVAALACPDALTAARRLETWRQDLAIAPLSSCGVAAADLPDIAAQPSGSIRTNPVALPSAALVAILEAARSGTLEPVLR